MTQTRSEIIQAFIPASPLVGHLGMNAWMISERVWVMRRSIEDGVRCPSNSLGTF